MRANMRMTMCLCIAAGFLGYSRSMSSTTTPAFSHRPRCLSIITTLLQHVGPDITSCRSAARPIWIPRAGMVTRERHHPLHTPSRLTSIDDIVGRSLQSHLPPIWLSRSHYLEFVSQTSLKITYEGIVRNLHSSDNSHHKPPYTQTQ
jgi:hypothetical protein